MYKERIEKVISNPQDDCSQLLNIPVIEILKIIQEQMTSKNDQERSKATNFMRRILSNKEYQYNEEAQDFLFQFFIQKMSDTSSIIDTTYILMFIAIKSIECQNQKIINSLLIEINENRIHIQGYNRESRINIYKIFQNLIHVEITHQLISAFLKSIAGEKDPRNIMVCFEILEILLSNPLIDQYSDEVFQFLDCYYPIEFQDRADPRYQLNKKDIVYKLDMCLSKKVVIKKTLGMLIEKIDSHYDEAQLSAFSTLKVILNQDILDASQLDIMGDALQFITENYLSDMVIEELICTFQKIIDYALAKDQYAKVANKIISIQFNKIQEIPNSQQAQIGEKILIYCLKFSKISVLQKYIEQFLRVQDHTHKPILLRRIQILLQMYDYIIEEKIEVNVLDNLMIKLKESLMDILQKQSEEIFIITLKIQLDIQILSKQDRKNQSIETLLFNKLQNSQDITLQKCIFDFFTIIGVIGLDIYKQNVDQISNHDDKELFYYSLICSFSNVPNYFVNYQNQLISTFENQDHLIRSLLQTIKYLTNNKYIAHNEELKIKQQDQINSIILQWINLDKIGLVTNKELQKLLKSLFIVLYSKCQNQLILDQIQQIFTFQNIINLKDQIVYFYIRLILHEKSKQQQIDLTQEICQYLKETKFNQVDSEKKYRRQIYKLILKLILNINIDEYQTILSNFLVSEYDFDVNGFNQKMLQGVVIITGITQNNQKYFQYLNNPKFEQNLRLFRDILRHINNNSVDYHQYLLMLYLKNHQEYPKSQRITLNHIDFSSLNLDLQESDVIIKEIIKIIPTQCQHISTQKELDQLIQLCDKYQKGNTVNILQGLLYQFQDQNIIKEIIYQIGYRLQELQYNLQLCQQVISQIQTFLSHQKRVVRKAAQYTINELYLISK